jgi:hypothetical protein
VKIHTNLVNFHKILLKFTKIRMDFQLTNFFGEFYMFFSLSVKCKKFKVKENFLALQNFLECEQTQCLIGEFQRFTVRG